MPSMLTTFRKCVPLVERNRRWAWIVLIALGLVASFLEIVSALLVFLLLTIIGRPDDPISVPGLGDLENHFPGASRTEIVVGIGIAIAAFFLVRGGFILVQTYLQSRVASNAGVTLSTKLLRGYLSMDYTFHLRRNSAELIRNVAQSVDVISQTLFVSFIAFVTELLAVMGLTVLLVVAAPVPTLSVGLSMGLVTFAILRFLNPRFEALGKTNQATLSNTWRLLATSLDGVRDLTILGRTGFVVDRYGRERATLSRVRYMQATLSAFPRIALETVLVVFIVVLIVVVLVTSESDTALAVLGLFGFTALRTLPAISRMITYVNSMRYSTAAIDDIYDDVLEMNAREVRRRERGTTPPLVLRDEIRVEGVIYRYPGTDVDVLHGIDLSIRRGQSVGIVGTTGAGKSTLVDIVLGLLTPTAGRVLVDGTPIQTAPEAWQRSLGVVSQAVYLSDDTLRANIAFGIEPEEVDESRVAAAVEIAQLGPFVASLPDGLDTVVGERGVRLSGGERQRVAIARALYHDPDVLVFDEGTSSLDNVTEAQLINAVERLRGHKTIITIAHRLSTVRGCDVIVLLESGRVVAAGTFDELAAKSDVFRRMASLHEPA